MTNMTPSKIVGEITMRLAKRLMEESKGYYVLQERNGDLYMFVPEWTPEGVEVSELILVSG